MKKIFGKGGIIDNETRRWDKQADQVTRNGDALLAEVLGMPENVKPSHALNSESNHHKEAVKFFQGKKITSDANSTADSSQPIMVDQSKPNEVTVRPTPEVQTTTASGASAVDTLESAVSSVMETEIIDDKLNIAKELETSSPKISPRYSDDKAKVVENVTSIEQAKTASETNQDKTLVWAKLLLDHKELTSTDKQGLPHFIKTEQEVISLTNKIFELASREQDSSFIAIAIDLVAEINDFYTANSLLG